MKKALDQVRRSLESYPAIEEGVFVVGESRMIVKGNVYKGQKIYPIMPIKHKDFPAYIKKIRADPEYREIEENVLESESSAVIIMGRNSYQLNDGWKKYSPEGFLKWLDGYKKISGALGGKMNSRRCRRKEPSYFFLGS